MLESQFRSVKLSIEMHFLNATTVGIESKTINPTLDTVAAQVPGRTVRLGPVAARLCGLPLLGTRWQNPGRPNAFGSETAIWKTTFIGVNRAKWQFGRLPTQQYLPQFH